MCVACPPRFYANPTAPYIRTQKIRTIILWRRELVKQPTELIREGQRLSVTPCQWPKPGEWSTLDTEQAHVLWEVEVFERCQAVPAGLLMVSRFWILARSLSSTSFMLFQTSRSQVDTFSIWYERGWCRIRSEGKFWSSNSYQNSGVILWNQPSPLLNFSATTINLTQFF
jgi:hypothetical protein